MGGKITEPKTRKIDYKTRKKNAVKADAGYLMVGALVLVGGIVGWRYYASTQAGTGAGAGAGQLARPAPL